MAKDSGKLAVGFLFDDTLDSNDGVSQYVKTVGSWLTKNGHEVTYLVGESSLKTYAGGEVYSLSKNLGISWGGNRLSMSLIPRLGLIKKIVAEKDFDVVHVMFIYSPFMAQFVINGLKPTTAVVGTVHIYPAHALSSLGSRLLKAIYGKSLRRFDKFISVSTAAASYAKKTFGLDSAVVPNTLNFEKFNSVRPKTTTPSQRIVFLGRLTKRKGCEHLIKAFGQVGKDVQGLELIIAGDGPERKKLEQLSDSLKIINRVRFLGFIKEEDKASLLASADIACFPSLYGESFGIVLIEAMAAGAKVVLGGNNPGYASVLGAQPDLLIDPRNPTEFAGRLSTLLRDESKIKKLHDWQMAEVQKYDVNIIGADLLKIYQQAIVKRKQKMQ